MAKWRITCIEFSKVRDMISDKRSVKEILNELLNVCRKYSDEDKYNFADDFQELTEEIEEALEYDDIDEENCDYFLSEFYDLCDAVRIWLDF